MVKPLRVSIYASLLQLLLAGLLLPRARSLQEYDGGDRAVLLVQTGTISGMGQQVAVPIEMDRVAAKARKQPNSTKLQPVLTAQAREIPSAPTELPHQSPVGLHGPAVPLELGRIDAPATSLGFVTGSGFDHVEIPIFVSRRRRQFKRRHPQVEGTKVREKVDYTRGFVDATNSTVSNSVPAQAREPARGGSQHHYILSKEYLTILCLVLGIPVTAFFAVVIAMYFSSRQAKASSTQPTAEAKEKQVASPVQPIPRAVSQPCVQTGLPDTDVEVGLTIGNSVRAGAPRGRSKQALMRPFPPQPNPGFLQRWIFGSDFHRLFASGSDASLRASLVVALCAMCWWIPSLQWLTEQGPSLQYAVTVFAFTFSMNAGLTMAYSSRTLIGTAVAVANCLFMFAWFPEGVTETNTRGAILFASAHFVCMSIMYVTLNWPMQIRMFAMYLQAYFTMSFVNPDSKVHFAHSVRDMGLKDGLTGPLLGTVLGCMASIAASLCPQPLSAFKSAQDQALEVSWEVGHCWDKIVECHVGSGTSFEAEALLGKASRLNERITRLVASTKISWWECFDLGRLGQVRAHLFRLHETFTHLHDWIQGTVAAAKCKGVHPSHAALMQELKAHLEAVNLQAWTVLHHSTRLAVSGEFGAPEELRLRHELTSLQSVQQDLAVAFPRAHLAVFGHEGLAPDALREHFLVFALNSYAKCVSEYAAYLLADQEHAGTEERDAAAPSTPRSHADTRRGRGVPLRFWQRSSEGISFRSSLRSGLQEWTNEGTLFSWDHLRQSARILMAYMGAFFIGRFGIPGIMSDYTSTPAQTTMFLLAFDTLGGSAFQKKFVRFQGLAVGTVLAQLVYVLLVRCNFWGIASGFLGVLVFEFLAFYFYFTSEQDSYTGLLIATFGAEQMLSGCGGLEESPWEVYQALLDQVVAIFCVSVADLLLAPPSPSSLAVQAYSEAAALSRIATHELLLADESGAIALHRDEILAKLSLAQAGGLEASLEPRFIRTPWREELWDTLVRHSFRLAQKLVVMEYIAAQHCAPERAAPRRRSVVRLLQSPSLQRAGDLLQRQREETLALAQELMLHETQVPLFCGRAQDVHRLLRRPKSSGKMNIVDIVADLRATCDAENYEVLMPPDEAPGPAEVGEVGAFLLMLELSMEDLDAIATAILKAPELSIHAIRQAARRPPKAGLLRLISLRVDSALKRSEESLQKVLRAISHWQHRPEAC